MKRFSNIQDALEFAARNQYRLRFPFTCKCNGFALRVLSPAIARTIDRDRPTLVVMRNRNHALDLGYVVSVRSLKKLLGTLSNHENQYTLVPGSDDVTVFCRTASGASSQLTFPLAHRAPQLAENEGEYVFLLAKPTGNDWHRFWIPLEARLLHSSITSAA